MSTFQPTFYHEYDATPNFLRTNKRCEEAMPLSFPTIPVLVEAADVFVAGVAIGNKICMPCPQVTNKKLKGVIPYAVFFPQAWAWPSLGASLLIKSVQ